MGDGVDTPGGMGGHHPTERPKDEESLPKGSESPDSIETRDHIAPELIPDGVQSVLDPHNRVLQEIRAINLPTGLLDILGLV